MSIKNHPNFNSVRFATKIMESYYDCPRGKGEEIDLPDIGDFVIDFTNAVEELIDAKVEKRDQMKITISYPGG